MIPASMFGSVTTRVTLDGSLPPLDSPGTQHTGIAGAVRAGVNHSTCVTTQKQQKEDCSSMMCDKTVVMCFGALSSGEGEGCFYGSLRMDGMYMSNCRRSCLSMYNCI